METTGTTMPKGHTGQEADTTTARRTSLFASGMKSKSFQSNSHANPTNTESGNQNLCRSQLPPPVMDTMQDGNASNVTALVEDDGQCVQSDQYHDQHGSGKPGESGGDGSGMQQTHRMDGRPTDDNNLDGQPLHQQSAQTPDYARQHQRRGSENEADMQPPSPFTDAPLVVGTSDPFNDNWIHSAVISLTQEIRDTVIEAARTTLAPFRDLSSKLDMRAEELMREHRTLKQEMNEYADFIMRQQRAAQEAEAAIHMRLMQRSNIKQRRYAQQDSGVSEDS